MRYYSIVDGQEYAVEITEEGESTRVILNGRDVAVDLKQVHAPSLYSLLLAHHSFDLLVEEREDDFAVFLETELYEVQVQSERERRRGRAIWAGRIQTGETDVKAPMSGLVLAVSTEVGALVTKGQSLVVLGAMKMENEIRAPQDGTVKQVAVSPGHTVRNGELLVVIE